MSDSASSVLGTTQVQQNSVTAPAAQGEMAAPEKQAAAAAPAAPATTPVEAPKADPLAPKFAALTRRERDIQRKEKELAEREVQIREGVKKKASEDPLKALEEMGLSYDQLTEFLLKQGKTESENKLSKVEQELQDWKKEQKDREVREQRAREEAAIGTFKEDIKKFVSENAETYGLVAESQSHELVFSTVDAVFAKTGKVIAIEEAVKLVEAHLEAEVDKIASYKKVQQRLAKKPPEEQPKGEEAKKTEDAPTLTNAIGVRATMSRPTTATEESEFEAALRMLKSTAK